jgi:hypothetical protein
VPNLAGLVSLQHLDLSFNKLSMVAKELSLVISLVHLDLSGKCISFTMLSSFLCLPGSVRERKWKSHSPVAQGNLLTTLPPELRRLTRLKTMYLTGTLYCECCQAGDSCPWCWTGNPLISPLQQRASDVKEVLAFLRDMVNASLHVMSLSPLELTCPFSLRSLLTVLTLHPPPPQTARCRNRPWIRPFYRRRFVRHLRCTPADKHS